MTSKKPTAFKILITVISITALVFLAATLFSYYRVDKKYSMILAFFMFVALAFTTIGIYSGIKYKSDENKTKIQNRIGLIGNLLIFLVTIGLMLFAALTKAVN
jgi:hypothetical protein